MEYIVTKRMKKVCLSGPVNLAYGTVCEDRGDGIIVRKRDQLPLCGIRSQDAYDYFSRNDDGAGLERGRLVNDIMYLLRVPMTEDPAAHERRQRRWERVWRAQELHRFKRPEHEDHWLWNFDFFNADIPDLKHILEIVKGA